MGLKIKKIKLFLPEYIIVICLIITTLFINFKMIRDGINGMTDLKWHITWLQSFSQEFFRGFWYPRWLSDTNYGYGSPTFVFYPPLIYYFGTLLKYFDFNTEKVIVILFSLALFLSGLNFYIFGRKVWGIIPSFMGALAYMSAPYLIFDIYYRGGLASIFMQAWIPLLWWLTEKNISNPKFCIGLAIAWAIISLTHAPGLLLCFISWLFYCLFFLVKHHVKAVVRSIIFTAIGLGLASLYLLPAILEKSLVNTAIMTTGIGEFRKSLIGTGLPLFPLHWNRLLAPPYIPYIFIHQSLVIIVLIGITLVWFRQDKKLVKEISIWGIFAIAIALMMSSFSQIIWKTSSTLQMLQFPWRFLQVYSFIGAILLAIVTQKIIKNYSHLTILPTLIIIFILLANLLYGYKFSRQFVTIHNYGKANIEHLQFIVKMLQNADREQLIDAKEYRPILKNKSLPVPKIGQPKVSAIAGKAVIEIERWDSDRRLVNVTVEENAEIKIRIYYYPAWHLYINNVPHSLIMAEDGTLKIELSPGYYRVDLRYEWTPAFKIGVILSIFNLIILCLICTKSPIQSKLHKLVYIS